MTVHQVMQAFQVGWCEEKMLHDLEGYVRNEHVFWDKSAKLVDLCATMPMCISV